MIAENLISSLHNSAFGLSVSQLMFGKTMIVILASAMIATADQAADTLTTTGISEFTAAYQAWNGARFGKAGDLFNQAAALTPQSVTNYYWRGTALFHRMLQLRDASDTKSADAAMDAAVAALETAVKLDPGHGESHALLGTLYGMKINGSMIRAIRFGPSVQDHQRQALKNGATNPRVRYLLGTGQFHTAKDAAAKREGLNTLLKAEQLFVAEAKRPQKPFDPRWGYSSCLTFIGRSYETLGQPSEAADYYRKSLTEHPEDHIAKAGIKRLSGK